MAALKTNKIIPVLVVSFAVLAGLVFYKASSSGGAKPVVVEAGQWMRQAPVPLTSDADTSSDTIRAIRGQVSQANSQADESLAMNRKLMDKLDEAKTEKDELASEMEDELVSVVDETLQAQAVANQRQFDRMMARMGELVDQIGDVDLAPSTVAAVEDPKIDESRTEVSIPDGFGVNIEAGQFVSGEDLIEVFWIEPLDESINIRVNGAGGGVSGRVFSAGVGGGQVASGSVEERVNSLTETGQNAKALLMKPLDTYRELIDSASDSPGVERGELGEAAPKKMSSEKPRKIVEVSASWRGVASRQTSRVNRPSAEAVFTIPDLSVLSGAIATTSLVGRIYPDGNVVDPQFFKLIVGRENFTANYQDLPPEIEGMIFEGFGIGDFTTRCISGRLIAATFIFEDGTTRSMYPGDPGTRPNSGDSIGYITDAYGNPCVSGKLITDAKEYLAQGAAIAFASAYASAIRESQQTSVQSFNTSDGITGSTLTEVTGDVGRFAVASGLNAGLDRGARLLDELFQSSRSLIYAPSGMSVDIHLQQELRLDIETNARKIRYRKNVRVQSELD